jgi:protease I
MPGELEGRKVAMLATDGVEQVEMTEPWKALERAGAQVHLVSLKPGKIQGFNHLDKGDTFDVAVTVEKANASDYVALVLPGGVANPDALRTNARAVAFVREFMEADKPVAAICHAPWLLIEADAVRGRTLTSWPSLQTDIRNAGGDWVDKAVQVDQRLITSRKPEDLPQFCQRIVAEFSGRLEESRVDGMVEQSFPASDPMPSGMTIGDSDRGQEAR